VDNKEFRILALVGSLLRAAGELAPDWVKVQFFDIGTLPSSTRISRPLPIPRLFANSRRP